MGQSIVFTFIDEKNEKVLGERNFHFFAKNISTFVRLFYAKKIVPWIVYKCIKHITHTHIYMRVYVCMRVVYI